MKIKKHFFILPLLIILLNCGSTKKATSVGGLKTSAYIAFDDNRLQYEGRIGMSRSGAAALYWSGSIVRIRFEGTRLKALLKDYNGQNYFNVILDGKVIQKLNIDSAKKWYLLAENLASGPHIIELFKRTQFNAEYNRRYTRFYGFQLDNGRLLSPPETKKRKMEFYGNSITCGHAIEDSSGSDSGAAIVENNYLSYAALTARHFHAGYSCVAVSGIGLISGFRKAIMPEVYDLLNPADSTDKWNFDKYTPNIVVVNLLENDEAVIGRPESEPFKRRFGSQVPTEAFIIDAYARFISKLRAHYPVASIICVLGDMGITRPGSKWPEYVKQATAQLHDEKVYTYFFSYKGTPGHPQIKEQQMMAESLIQFVDQHNMW